MKTDSSRRKALAAAGIGALGAVFGPRLKAAEMSTTEKANVKVVNDFCASWAAHDPERIMSFFADPCAYRMTEASDPIKGREAVASRITKLLPSISGFDVVDTWARGPMVINERNDGFASGALKNWHGVGVFLLKDGKIVEWYDYTITMERR